jgi:hypothetical protein|tara:strand:+ start:111 stop:362 length:252 start_codon:yes stop_codon:yes gene_type:complete
MTAEEVSLKKVLQLARKLSPLDKVKLLEQMIPDLEAHLRSSEASSHPLRSVYGLCADLGPAPSSEDIDDMRRDVFGDFGENGV